MPTPNNFLLRLEAKFQSKFSTQLFVINSLSFFHFFVVIGFVALQNDHPF